MSSPKVIVIGCTHAGTNAITSILTHSPSCQITVFERNDTISFLSCGIALWVEGVITQPNLLFYNSPENLAKQGVVTKMKHDVLDIDNANKTVKVKDLVSGNTFEEKYDKLVLTTGSWPIVPPIPGIDKNNIKLCKNYDHAKELVNSCGDKKRVIVVGAGYIGIELAEGFYAQKKEVVLIDALDRVVPRYFDNDFTDILETEIKSKGIELYLGQVVKEFLYDANDNTTGLRTDKGIELKSDLIILCIGFRPQTALFKGKVEQLYENGPVKVNEYMQTSDPNIYAAGDCASVYSNVIDQTTYIPLATNACRQGYILGMNILENKFKHPGTQGTSGIKIFSYKLGSTGLTGDSAKFYKIDTETVSLIDNHRPEFMPSYEQVKIKLVYEKETRQLKGGQIMSKYDLTQCMNIISVCIKNKMTIDELAFTDFFFQPFFNKPWHFINICAQQALKK